MSNLIMWNLIVGFLAPIVIALIQQPQWKDGVRAVVTGLFSVVMGAGTAYFNDQFNAKDIVGSILIVAVAAITFYKGFFKPTLVAPKIELATSPGRNVGHSERGEYSLVHILIVGVLLLVFLVILFRYVL